MTIRLCHNLPNKPSARLAAMTICVMVVQGFWIGVHAASLADLAAPHDGRSRRQTSTARLPNGDFCQSPGCLFLPILDSQSLDRLEMSHIAGHQRRPFCQRDRCDQIVYLT